MPASTMLLVLAGTAVVSFGLSLAVRRRFPRLGDVETSPWASTLSYIATAYGVVVGFSIIFLFGEFSDARRAVGNEATSIGTAFEEASLFPENATAIQHSLICYAGAVVTYDWPALQDKSSAPEADRAYRNIIETLGEVDEPSDGTFQPAAATNIFVQVGSISTAREARLVAAEVQVPTLLWVLLYAGGLLVISLIFVLTLAAGPVTQAMLVSFATLFTVVMILIVVALANPFVEGTGRVTPQLIEQTQESMSTENSAAANMPCPD